MFVIFFILMVIYALSILIHTSQVAVIASVIITLPDVMTTFVDTGLKIDGHNEDKCKTNAKKTEDHETAPRGEEKTK